MGVGSGTGTGMEGSPELASNKTSDINTARPGSEKAIGEGSAYAGAPDGGGPHGARSFFEDFGKIGPAGVLTTLAALALAPVTLGGSLASLAAGLVGKTIDRETGAPTVDVAGAIGDLFGAAGDDENVADILGGADLDDDVAASTTPDAASGPAPGRPGDGDAGDLTALAATTLPPPPLPPVVAEEPEQPPPKPRKFVRAPLVAANTNAATRVSVLG